LRLKNPLCWVALVAVIVPSSPVETVCFPQDKNSQQHFVCNTGYSLQQCHEQMAVLRQALAKYPLEELGEWTWILVRSQDWKPIVGPRGLSPNSPAFTYYQKRETFLEEALVGEVPVRRGELLKEWGMSMPALLDVAIAHELGHALCNEKDEAKVNRFAQNLQQGKPIGCEFKLVSKRHPDENTEKPTKRVRGETAPD